MKRLMVSVFFGVILFSGCHKKTSTGIYTGVLEGKTIQVPALTGGRIEKMVVDTGFEVRQGDTLALMDTQELRIQYKQIEASLEELRIQTDIAETNLERTLSDWNYAKESFGRVEVLVQKEASTLQKRDDMENLMERAESACKTAKQQKQSLHARQKQVAAQAELVRKKIQDAVVVAPISGLVTTLYYEQGEAVPPMAAVVEVVRIDELELKIYLPETMLSKIRIGQKAAIAADGVKSPFDGRVAWISPKAEFTPKNILTPETRTSLVYAVQITVSNPQKILKHGMPVEVCL